jgi:hypothetical protein
MLRVELRVEVATVGEVENGAGSEEAKSELYYAKHFIRHVLESYTIQLTSNFLLFNVTDSTDDTVCNLHIFTVAAHMLSQVSNPVRMLRTVSQEIKRSLIDL